MRVNVYDYLGVENPGKALVFLIIVLIISVIMGRALFINRDGSKIKLSSSQRLSLGILILLLIGSFLKIFTLAKTEPADAIIEQGATGRASKDISVPIAKDSAKVPFA